MSNDGISVFNLPTDYYCVKEFHSLYIGRFDQTKSVFSQQGSQ